MELDLNLAKKKSGEYIHIENSVEIDNNLVKDFGVNFASKCELKIDYKYLAKEVSVRGQGSVYLTGNCFRCGNPFKKQHKFEFEDIFLPASSKVEEVEEVDYTFNGTFINITKMIEDNLLTSLPHQFLCKDDCKGLCPQCFANLNTQTCACKPLINNAFACLNDLKFD